MCLCIHGVYQATMLASARFSTHQSVHLYRQLHSTLASALHTSFPLPDEFSSIRPTHARSFYKVNASTAKYSLSNHPSRLNAISRPPQQTLNPRNLTHKRAYLMRIPTPLRRAHHRSERQHLRFGLCTWQSRTRGGYPFIRPSGLMVRRWFSVQIHCAYTKDCRFEPCLGRKHVFLFLFSCPMVAQELLANRFRYRRPKVE